MSSLFSKLGTGQPVYGSGLGRSSPSLSVPLITFPSSLSPQVILTLCTSLSPCLLTVGAHPDPHLHPLLLSAYLFVYFTSHCSSFCSLSFPRGSTSDPLSNISSLELLSLLLPHEEALNLLPAHLSHETQAPNRQSPELCICPHFRPPETYRVHEYSQINDSLL